MVGKMSGDRCAYQVGFQSLQPTGSDERGVFIVLGVSLFAPH